LFEPGFVVNIRQPQQLIAAPFVNYENKSRDQMCPAPDVLCKEKKISLKEIIPQHQHNDFENTAKIVTLHHETIPETGVDITG
jgi:hypothetical protein